MKLSELLKAIRKKPQHTDGHDSDPEIVSLHYRSDTVKPGGLFIAIPGFAADGHDFIDEALDRGAAAVIIQKAVDKKGIVVRVDNSRAALSALSARFYHQPSENMTVIGITGTNGKTTTSYLVESILSAAGKPSGVIGTVNYRYASKTFESTMTTPESLDLHRILSEMSNEGVSHVVLEASSHAVDLDRIRNACIRIGIFTNLTQDHLDYHKDMASYWACKQRLFTECLDTSRKKDPARAVINCLNEYGRELRDILSRKQPQPVITSIGDGPNDDIRVTDASLALAGIQAEMKTPKGTLAIQSSLVGRFNLENILCAVGAGVALDLPLSTIQTGIATFDRVPGRLDPVDNAAGRFVFVDYAHTPDALENVLETLRQLASGRLICVFGCGGDRDRTKRPLMGKIAGRLSDLAIVTSDNPRTEDPVQIIDHILDGVRSIKPKAELMKDSGAGGYFVEPNRRAAIRMGIGAARLGDTVLIAGKGHEDYQIIGTKKAFFDDRIEAQAALRELKTK